MPISYNLINEIDKKMEKVSSSPDYFLGRANKIRADLRNLSAIHSFWLENPQLRTRILEDNNVKSVGELKRKARFYVRKIQEAWRYLGNLKGEIRPVLNPEIIANVGKIIEPELNKNGFRTQRVTIGLQYTPPNPFRVPEKVERCCYELRESDYHPVEAAAVAHLTLAGIQPFRDGNKRTSRLIQDKILADAGLPPAFIPFGERDVYIDLLEQGLVGIRDRDLKSQRPFFDYIGGKVNTALDEIINDLAL